MLRRREPDQLYRNNVQPQRVEGGSFEASHVELLQGLCRRQTRRIEKIVDRELLEDRGAFLISEIDDQFAVKLAIEPTPAATVTYGL